MPVDFSAREDAPPSDPEASAFAPTPVFARPTKRSRRGRAAAPAATPATTTTADDVLITREQIYRDDVPDEFERPAKPASHGVPVAALIAVPVALVVLGGAYYWMSSRDAGQPLASNMQTAPAAIATAPAVTTPVTPPAETMPRPLPEAAPPARTERAEAPAPAPHAETRVARARPAPAPAAEESASEASAVAPVNPPSDASARTDTGPPMSVAPPPLTLPPVSGPVNPPANGPVNPPVSPGPEVSGATPETPVDGSSATP